MIYHIRAAILVVLALQIPSTVCLPRSLNSELQRRDDYTGLSKYDNTEEAKCGPDYGNSKEDNIKIWYGVNAQPGFDEFMSKYPDDIDQATGAGWLRKMTDVTYLADDPMADCESITGSCQVSIDICSEYERNSSARSLSQTLTKTESSVHCDSKSEGCGSQYYWIMKSIELWHQHVKDFQKYVVEDQTIASLLSVDSIVKDFGPSTAHTGPNLWGILSGSFGAASAVMSLSGGGALAGFASGLFGVVLQLTAESMAPKDNLDPEDIIRDLNDMLKDYFTSMNAAISQYLRDMTGNGDMRNLDYGALTNTALSKYPIVQTLDQGKFLYSSSDAGGTEATQNLGTQVARDTQIQMIAYSRVIGSRAFVAIWDHWYGTEMNEEHCNARRDLYRMARWITYGPLKLTFCMELLAAGGGPGGFEHTNCRGSNTVPSKDCIHEPSRLDDDQINSMFDDYDFDPERFYTNAMTCFEDNAHEDPSQWPRDGSLPPCFHDVWLAHGSFVAVVGDEADTSKAAYWKGLDREGEYYKPAYL